MSVRVSRLIALDGESTNLKMHIKALLLALETSRVCPAELNDLGKAVGGGRRGVGDGGVMLLKFRLTSAGQHPLQRVCKPLVGGLIDDCSLLDINTHTHTHTHTHRIEKGAVFVLQVVCEQIQMRLCFTTNSLPTLLTSFIVPAQENSFYCRT